MQPWYALADEALEDALHDRQALRRSVGIDLGGGEAVPDVTTLLHFRHRAQRPTRSKSPVKTRAALRTRPSRIARSLQTPSRSTFPTTLHFDQRFHHLKVVGSNPTPRNHIQTLESDFASGFSVLAVLRHHPANLYLPFSSETAHGGEILEEKHLVAALLPSGDQ